MILAVLAAIAAQAIVPSAGGLSTEQRIDVLAQSEARNPVRMSMAVYEDPALRSEIRRVGLRAGCAAAATASSEAARRYGPTLKPYAVAAIKAIVPERALAEARFLSAVAPPFNVYAGRVRAEIDRTAAEPIKAARAQVRRRFLELVRHLPEARGEEVKPAADISAVFNLKGKWDLENPGQLGLACIELQIDPSVRPTITTGSERG